MELGSKADRGFPVGLNSSKPRQSKSLFCSPGFLQVWFMNHVRQHQLELLGTNEDSWAAL